MCWVESLYLQYLDKLPWCCRCIILGSLVQQSILQLPPYFFICSFKNTIKQPNLETKDVSLSVVIEGNPLYYLPGKKYNGKLVESFEVCAEPPPCTPHSTAIKGKGDSSLVVYIACEDVYSILSPPLIPVPGLASAIYTLWIAR